MLCSPDDGTAQECLHRPLFGMFKYDLRAYGGGIEFTLSHGAWIRLLRENGLDVLDLIEVQAPPEAETHPFYGCVTAEWARRWPAEEFWIARKR